jgi:hypothetical protein
MLGVGTLVSRVGSAQAAERILRDHFVSKRGRSLHDNRYASMEFLLKWSPLFRRHAGPASPI